MTLLGFVSNYAQKMTAEHAAERVQGVQGIAEELKVRFPSDPKTSDEEIARRVLDVFAWDVTVAVGEADAVTKLGRSSAKLTLGTRVSCGATPL